MNARLLPAVLLGLVTASAAAAQTGTLTLDALQRAAADADPRIRQLALEARQTELRLQTIAADRKPALRLEGRAQHQSDVPSSPLFSPPRTSVDSFVGVEQRLFDATLAARDAAARAALDETRARIAVALYGVRVEVSEAYFGALDAAARVSALDARIAALEALHRVADTRVREGAALAGEARAIEATLLERRRDRASLEARRRAAIARLSQAAGITIPPDADLALPGLEAAVAEAAAGHAALRARPEFTQFDRARDRLAAEADGLDAARKPRVSAFARAGYGRPGLNFIADRWDAYWLGGVQLQWTPVTWGNTARERETLDLQREIVSADEAAFAARLARTAAAELADVARLEAMLAADAGVVALREAVERETHVRWQERVITLQEYLDRSGELLDAQLALAARRVELAAARARLLTTLGLEAK
jgi:outer membrane protein TolC